MLFQNCNVIMVVSYNKTSKGKVKCRVIIILAYWKDMRIEALWLVSDIEEEVKSNSDLTAFSGGKIQLLEDLKF